MRPDRDHHSNPDRPPRDESRPVEVDAAETRPGALTITVVRYPERADRCTIYPSGLTGVPLMSTWISADRAALVDLRDRR